MKPIIFILSILFISVLFSCEDKMEDDGPGINPVEHYKSIDVITGVDFYDANGLPIGRWGFPNHKKGEDIFVYPIPNNGVFSVSTFNQKTIKRIWLVAAECMKDSVTVDIQTLSQNLSYTVSELETAQIKDIPTPDFIDAIQLDFSDVAAGFYKLYYQNESDEIFWYNMHIDPNVTNFPDFDFMDNNCL